MRIDYLRLPAFGVFTDETIRFPQDRGLHIIYGRNEAGKSTLLRAVSDALFGIPRDSGADFQHKASNLRIEAGLTMADGTQLAFRRRYALRKSVLDLDDQPLDDEFLRDCTCGLTRSEFENMFGLDHLRLRQGGRELLEAGGSLGESLLAAAAGLPELRERLEKLQSEADALFRPTATKRKVNSLAREFREHKRAVGQAVLSPGKFQQLEEEFLAQQAQLQNLEEQLAAAEQRQQKLKRIQRTRPLLAERRAVLAELEGLGDLPPLAPDSQERFNTHSAALGQAQDERRIAEGRVRRLEEEIDGLLVSQAVVDQEEAINQLQQDLSLYRETVKQLPSLEEQVESLQQGAWSKLKDLHPQAQDLEDAERYRFPVHLRETLGELADRLAELETELDKAAEARAGRTEDVETTRRALQEFGSLADITILQTLVGEINKAGDLEAALAEQQRRAEGLRASLDLELQRLPLWTGTVEELAAAELPLPATVAAYEEEGRELAQERRDAAKAKAELEERRAALERELAGLTAEGAMPSWEEVLLTRQHRDRGWQLVRRAWLDNELDPGESAAFAGDRPLAEAYEESVAAADQAADDLWAASDKAARRTALDEQRQAVQEELKASEQQLAAVAEREQAFRERWLGLWSHLGLEPLSPKEMGQWLTLSGTLVAQFQACCQAEREVLHLEEKIAAFSQRLQDALAELGAKGQGTLSQLLAHAEGFCREVLERKGEYNGLQRQLRDQEAEAARAGRRVDELLAEQAEWRQRWEELLQEVGLPSSTTVQAALKFLAAAEELVDRVDKLAEANGKKRRQESFLTAFRRQAQNTARQVGLEEDAQDAAALVERLVRLSRETAAIVAARGEKESQLERELELLVQLDLKIRQAQDALNELMDEVRVDTRQELERVLSRQARAMELRERLENLEQQLLRSGDGLSLKELAEEGEGVDVDAIPHELDNLAEAILRWRQEKDSLHESFGVLKKDYEKMVEGGAAAAAQAAEEAQETLARLAKAAERYLQVRTAALILQRAMERYQEEYQSPVLQRAGSIFAQLTAESFHDLAVDYDEQGNPVIKGLRGQELVGVEGMSDGTQDQLYLALRLASIEGFLDQGEVLPFIADDLLVNFDDFRAGAALQVLAELSRRTQVILFTHHLTLVQLAQRTLPPELLSVHYLGEVPAVEELEALQLA